MFTRDHINDKAKNTQNDELIRQYKILKLLIRYGNLNKIILVVKYAIDV